MAETLYSLENGGSGLAGVRHLRDNREWRRRARTERSKTTDSIKAPLGSPRQRRRIEDTHSYLCAKVDPIMGLLITYLISERPNDVQSAMLGYLLARREGLFLGCGSARDGDIMPIVGSDCTFERGSKKYRHKVGERLTKHEDRVYMARQIGPLIIELIHRTLRRMPADVESFLVEQLQEKLSPPFLQPEALPKFTSPSEVQGQDRRHFRPSTARSRLQHAQSIDSDVQKTSPPRMEKAEIHTPPVNVAISRSEELISSPGNHVISEGVTESQNRPWDVEIDPTATLPPSKAESLSSSASARVALPKLAVILLLGIDGAGKSTLLGTLQGDPDPQVRPSVGFKPVTMMLSDKLKVSWRSQ
ncbi:unnamed protein product [Choristocarpus tenellus]